MGVPGYFKFFKKMEERMEPITVLNNLSWQIGEPIPQMFIDGNIIPLSQMIISILQRPVDHKIPLRLYFDGVPSSLEPQVQ